jgi:hypothetical protein
MFHATLIIRAPSAGMLVVDANKRLPTMLCASVANLPNLRLAYSTELYASSTFYTAHVLDMIDGLPDMQLPLDALHPADSALVAQVAGWFAREKGAPLLSQ